MALKVTKLVAALKLGSVKRAFITHVLKGNPEVEQAVELVQIADVDGEARKAFAAVAQFLQRFAKLNNDGVSTAIADFMANPLSVILSEPAQRAAWNDLKGWNIPADEQIAKLKAAGIDTDKLAKAMEAGKAAEVTVDI